VLRAVAGGALDRALDVAATLEVRGYGSARRGSGQGRPWSRHDLAFLASALIIVALAVAGRLAHVAGFEPYPELHGDGVAAAGALAAAFAVAALAPFAQRRGIGA
jgi:energy-coupling factor transport system permease protein